ncbi:hypothetical protein [Gordonia sp. (in: high G+C Gram-positive bacteria)]|uniref:hypothetical protein n=1 Tax=Gordonia sp. (in: high G+C Gram-positive bacteria) TaxID=84139 RepID=UPI003C71529C
MDVRLRWSTRIVCAALAVLLVSMGATLVPSSPLAAPAAAAPETRADIVKDCNDQLNRIRVDHENAINPARKIALVRESKQVKASCDQRFRAIGEEPPVKESQDCSKVDVKCNISKAMKDAAGNAFQSAAKSVMQGFARMIQLAMSWYIKIPTPRFQDYSIVQEIQRATIGLQLFGLVLSLLIIAFRLIMAKRAAAAEEAQEAVKSMAKAVFGAWAFGGILVTLTIASDALAAWMLDQATDGKHAGQMVENVASLTGGGAALIPAFGSGLVLVVGVIGIALQVVQIVMLVARQAMLAVVVSLIPVIGAFGATSVGRASFSKVITWTIALLLFKPVSAAVYWVAFWMAGTNSGNPQEILMGMVLMSLAALVMPVLIKLVSGGQSMVGTSGAAVGGAVMGAVAAGGMIAATGGAGAGGAGAAGGGGASTATMAGAAGGGGGGGGGQLGGTGSPPRGGDGTGQTPKPAGQAGTGAPLVPAAPEAASGGSGSGGGSGGGGGVQTAVNQLVGAGSATGSGQSANSGSGFFDSDGTESAGAGDSLR